MDASDFLLSVISASGGRVQGRTLLQKRCYFAAVLLGKEKSLGFQAHYYGPYSPALDAALSQLAAVGFVEERRIGFRSLDSSGFEIRRHDYELTADGREIVDLLKLDNAEEFENIRQAVEKLADAGASNYFELSIAAKAFYIIRCRNNPVTIAEIKKEALHFGWEIEPKALDQAISFLERILLVQKGKHNEE